MKFIIAVLMLVVVANAGQVDRQRRFLLNLIKRCSSEMDCGPGQCCLLNKLCAPKLPKYSTCYLTNLHKCGCADGLSCQVTKEFEIFGQKIQFRQCMPSFDSFTVEHLKEEDVEELANERQKRFLVDRCTTDDDCGENRCCLFGKLCARKLPKLFTCYLVNKHKCGCQDGLECRVTTSITIPIIGSKIPIRQCVPVETPDV